MATPRQIETSMSKKYKGTAKVSQTTIDNIKKMGMTASLKKAASSKNPEYIEGIRRMYGAKRLAAAQGSSTPSQGTNRMSPRVAERSKTVVNKPSARAAESKTSKYGAYANSKATPQQLEQGRLRAKASGIEMNTSAKGLRTANKAILIGATSLGAAGAVKGAAAGARALKGSRAVQSASGRVAAKRTGEVTQEQYAAMRATKIKSEARKTAVKRITKAAGGRSM
jgi:hypothetical protein